MRLTHRQGAPLPCAWRLQPGAVLQAGRLAAYAARHPDSAFLGVLAASCACALTYNVVHCLMIQRTSAVTTTVLGEIKIVAILMLSAAVFGARPGSLPVQRTGRLHMPVRGPC